MNEAANLSIPRPTIADTPWPDHLSDEADVIACYRFFHARDPESPLIVAELVGRPLKGLILGGVNSDEFRRRVVSELVQGGKVPQAQLSAKPDAEQIGWIRQNVPLTAETKQTLSGTRSWSEALRTLLGDAIFGLSIPDTYQAIKASEPALAAMKLPQQADLVGEIEGCFNGELRGWAADRLSPQKPVTLEILANGRPVGIADCFELRRDIQVKLGLGDGRFGFRFALPPALKRLYPLGFTASAVDFTTREAIAGSIQIDLSREFELGLLEQLARQVAQLQASLDGIKAQLPAALPTASYDLSSYQDYVEALSARHPGVERISNADGPVFTIILHGNDVDLLQLEGTLLSIAGQSYKRWQLLICEDGTTDRLSLDHAIERVLARDFRLRLIARNEAPPGAPVAEAALAEAQGDYVCFIAAGDRLHPDALAAFAVSAPDATLIYSDEDRFIAEGVSVAYSDPFFKPDYDWDLLLQQDYISRFVALRTDLSRVAGGLRSGASASRVFNLVLRVIERIRPDEIGHVAQVLYHRNGTVIEAPPLLTSDVFSVTDHLERLNKKAVLAETQDDFDPDYPLKRVIWAAPAATSTAIIIPTRDHPDLLSSCIGSLEQARELVEGEIKLVIVDNRSVEAETSQLFDRLAGEGASIIPYDGAFNWAAINNHAASRSGGDLLVFLNNDTRLQAEGSLAELIAQAARPEIGAVGARLLYEDGAVQHGGILLGSGGFTEHDGLGLHAGERGYKDRAHLVHRVSAVTGACLATSRKVFDELGGFDGVHYTITCSDADYCLRAAERGYGILYTPAATFYHLESRSRGFAPSHVEQAETTYFRQRWADKLDRDPFYNPAFDRHFRPFTRLR